jgi:hypothetical protein
MQINNIMMDQELDSFSSKGSTDAKLNQEVTVDQGKIKPAARNSYYKIKAQYAGAAEQAKMQYEQTEARLNELRSGLRSIKDKLENLEITSFFKLTCYYTLPGLIYVVGDIMFSMELVVKGWGLGQQNAFERYSLAIAIGLAPFFVKYIIDRFFEPNLENGSPQLKKLLTGAYLGLGLLMIFAFCQIAYVRNVFFRFMKTDIGTETNVYNILFENHSVAVALSFILVALMFVIGGGFLLSFSSREFSKRKVFNVLTKSKAMKQAELETKLEMLSDLKRQYVEAETILSDWNNKEECIEHIENELKYAYKNGFQNELTTANSKSGSYIGEIHEGKDNFHHFVRQLVDKYSMINKGDK